MGNLATRLRNQGEDATDVESAVELFKKAKVSVHA